jgi:hypothetical protein
MMLTDGLVARTLHPSQTVIRVVEALAVVVVLIVSRLLSKRKPGREKD